MEKYVRKVFEMGAEDVKVTSIDGIVFGPGTTHKCVYDSKDRGRNWACPSAPAPRTWTQILREHGVKFIRCV